MNDTRPRRWSHPEREEMETGSRGGMGGGGGSAGQKIREGLCHAVLWLISHRAAWSRQKEGLSGE